MTVQKFASVWDAIEDTPAQAETMKMRSELMMALQGYIAREGITQNKAAELFGVTQPRVSDLVRGKINLFSLEALIGMAAAARMHIELRVLEPA